MIVVDASAVVQILLRTPDAARVEAVLFGSGRALHAPHLIDVETASAFRRLAATGEIDPARGALMLDVLRDMPIERHAHARLLSRIWQLRDNVTAYDATYVALAEVLDATLVTRDGRLARAASRFVDIDLV